MSKLKSWAKKLQVGRAKKAPAMATLSQFRHRSPSPVYGRGRSRPPCILNVLDADGDSNTSQERQRVPPPHLEFSLNTVKITRCRG